MPFDTDSVVPAFVCPISCFYQLFLSVFAKLVILRVNSLGSLVFQGAHVQSLFFDLLTQFVDALNQRLGTGRTARNVDIHRDNGTSLAAYPTLRELLVLPTIL